jgi:hypothetical protein
VENMSIRVAGRQPVLDLSTAPLAPQQTLPTANITPTVYERTFDSLSPGQSRLVFRPNPMSGH